MFDYPLIIWLFLLLLGDTTVYTGTMPISETSEDFTYTTTTTSPFVNLQLTLTPFYSAGLFIGKAAPFIVSTNRENWIHFDYLSENGCDFEGMVTGRTQDAFVRNNGIGSIVYLQLINFEPTNAFTYTITITEGSSFIQTCPTGLIRSLTGEYCQFCDTAHVGAFCSITRHRVSPSSQFSITLPPTSFTYLLLQTRNQITLYLSMGSGLMVFIQTQTFDGQIAGITNYLSPGLAQGKYIYTIGQNVTLELPETGEKYLMGVINYQGTHVGLSILFHEKEGLNVTLIIIGVAGGLFLLVLVFAAIIIIRRISRIQRAVLPDGYVSQRQQRQRQRSNKMTAEEIDFYFPQLFLHDFYPKLQFEHSYENLKEEKMDCKMDPNDGLECVICLCSIADEEKVRTGYCKHIFHSACLTSWFSKQQNCPYCREDYGQSATIQRYKMLSAKTGKKIEGADIVRAIFTKNEQMTLNTIEITDISGQTFS